MMSGICFKKFMGQGEVAGDADGTWLATGKCSKVLGSCPWVHYFILSSLYMFKLCNK